MLTSLVLMEQIYVNKLHGAILHFIAPILKRAVSIAVILFERLYCVI